MGDERGGFAARALQFSQSREEPTSGLLNKQAARAQIRGQANVSLRASSRNSAHVVDQASLETDPAAIAAAIAKKIPARRRVCVRRRTISSTSGLHCSDNYGHVGIGIKIRVDAQKGKASISVLLDGGPADATGQIRAGTASSRFTIL